MFLIDSITHKTFFYYPPQINGVLFDFFVIIDVCATTSCNKKTRKTTVIKVSILYPHNREIFAGFKTRLQHIKKKKKSADALLRAVNIMFTQVRINFSLIKI